MKLKEFIEVLNNLGNENSDITVNGSKEFIIEQVIYPTESINFRVPKCKFEGVAVYPHPEYSSISN